MPARGELRRSPTTVPLEQARSSAVALLALVLLLLAACRVGSTNPLVSLAETAPIPESWLGTWRVDSIFDGPPQEGTRLEVERNADGSMEFTLWAADGTSSKNASITDITGATVVSVFDGVGAWSLMKVEIDPNGLRAGIRWLDPYVVGADIAAGTIAGKVEELEPGDTSFFLTATSAQLRSYLASRPNAFGPVVVELTKLPEAP